MDRSNPGRQSHVNEENILHRMARSGNGYEMSHVEDLTLRVNSRTRLQHITALHFAAFSGDTVKLNYLLSKNAHVNALDSTNQPPLHWAVIGNRKDVIKDLIRHGASVNSADIYGITALHMCAYHGHSDVAEYLLKRKALINAQDNQGWTPLHIALSRGHKRVVKLLLAYDAALHIKDKCKRTPEDLVKYLGHKALSGGFVRRGNRDSVQPLSSARSTGENVQPSPTVHRESQRILRHPMAETTRTQKPYTSQSSSRPNSSYKPRTSNSDKSRARFTSSGSHSNRLSNDSKSLPDQEIFASNTPAKLGSTKSVPAQVRTDSDIRSPPASSERQTSAVSVPEGLHTTHLRPNTLAESSMSAQRVEPTASGDNQFQNVDLLTAMDILRNMDLGQNRSNFNITLNIGNTTNSNNHNQTTSTSTNTANVDSVDNLGVNSNMTTNEVSNNGNDEDDN